MKKKPKIKDPKRLHSSEEAAIYRAGLLKSQSGIDPIIKKAIKDPVLDHQHFGNQYCRGVLERTVNSFEGKVYNAYQRYVKHHTAETLPNILRNLADYLEADYSANKIHHTAINVDLGKFKSLPATKQRELLIESGVTEPGANISTRVKQARMLITQGVLTTKHIETKKAG